MHGVSLVSLVCVSLCLVGAVGCGTQGRSAVGASARSEAEALSPAALMTGSTFSAHSPDDAARRGDAPQDPSHSVDSYLAWLAAFDGERRRAAAGWEQSLPRAEKLAAGVATGGGATDEQVRVAARMAEEFAAQSFPPADCRTLAELYGASLTKCAASLRCVEKVGVGGRKKGMHGVSMMAACADTGEAEMIKAETELRWVFHQFPRSKVPPFRLTF